VLLQNGANVNQLDTTNRTPIHYASSAGNTLAVKTLQRAGAHTNQCDRTPRIATKSAINPSSFVIPFVCVGKRPAST
jgi:ankyrin repeat protein